MILEPGPQGARGGETALESIKRTKEQLDYCFVNARMKWIFDGSPDVWLTFSWGNIGTTLTSDSANERHCLCHQYPHSKNTGCGGVPAPNLALKRLLVSLYYIYLSIRKPLCLENLVCTCDRNAASPRKVRFIDQKTDKIRRL